MKYRGGAPPPPPAWSYSRDDLRAFQKWERKLQVWRVQISSYLPPNEAAMMLYVSLKGEAEEELEYCSLDSINHDKGIDFILESLRKPLMTRSIYLKRRYLHEYENIQRSSNESIKAYCNRYHRTERSLESIGINVGSMYDSEARGSRLLDRMRVSLEQQRLILIGSGQSLHFDEVKEAAQLQFPDHRPTPMVTYMREFDNKGDRPQQAPQQSSSGKGFSFKKGKGKGKDKGKHQQNKAYVTEANAEDVAENGQEEEGDGDDIINNENENQEADDYVEDNQDFDGYGDEDEEKDDSADALREAAECLTVTARRLQGLTLGRKFSGQQSIQERKKNTHCAICGEKGHWQGDEECQYSGNGGKSQQKGSSGSSSNNRAKTGKAGSKGKSDNEKTKKVFTVMHHDGQSRTVTFQDDIPPEETYGTYFTYMVKSPCENGNISKIYGTSMNELCHFVVLDTACQKSCCSSQWMEHYQSILSNHRMKVKFTEKKEPFEFGHGPTQFSDHHAYMPVCFDGTASTTCLLGAYVIPNTNDIPFLGSHSLMQKLQMVLDLPHNKVRIGSLSSEVDMHMVNGHLALKIDQMKKGSCHDSVWKTLSYLSDQPEADAELMHLRSPPSSSTRQRFQKSSSPMQTQSAPPQWLIRWKHLVTKFFHAEMFMAITMLQAVKLRIRPRSWLQHQDPLDMESQKALLEKAEGPCQHEKIQRSGNRYGRYAKCLDCLMSWQWDEGKQKWGSKVSQKQRSLPLPSYSTAEVFLEKNHRPGWATNALKEPMLPLGGASMSSTMPLTNKMEKLASAKPKRSSAPKRNKQEAEEDDYDWALVDP